MTQLSLTVNADNLMQALLQTPELLAKNMANAVLRVSKEMANSAKDYAPKAFSTLTLSINNTQISPYEAIVAPGVDYARLVEEGTGPGAMPPVQNIEDWINVGAKIEPNNPEMTSRDLAYIIARSIAHHGTPAQPYMAPAFKDNRDKAERRINRAIDAALRGETA